MNTSSSTNTNSNGESLDRPWIEKYRPTTLDDVVGNPEVVDQLRIIRKEGNVPHLLLVGPPGTGKTTSIHALAHELLGENFQKATLELNASDDRGIDVVRDKIKSFATQKIPLKESRHKIIILDEADSMTEAAQQALRVIMADYSNTTRFALACNDSEKIIEPIQSRLTILRFSRLSEQDIRNRLLQVTKIENIPYDESGIKALLETAEGDMRYALNNMQSTFVGFNKITKENVYKIVDVPKPELVENIFKFCQEGNIKKAIFQINDLLSEGYNAYDVVAILSRLVGDYQMDDELKLDILKEISAFKMKVLDGIDSRLSIYGFVAKISELFIGRNTK